MPAHSELILPPRKLASCVVGGVMRDTRGTQLSDADRMNYFPASPLFTVTVTLVGQLQIAPRIMPLDALHDLPVAPRHLFMPPQSTPQTSWNAGPVCALTIAFFPDAWQRLGGALDGTPPDSLHAPLSLLEESPLAEAWPKFWDALACLWTQSAGKCQAADWRGSDRLKDWTYHLLGQLAQTGAGRGLRTAQRRLERWTGTNRQTLEFFAKVEEVHRLVTTEQATTPAELAVDAGFADQSYMGRALKRATGFSPVCLNRKIATEEPFWCYRVMGQRF